MKSQSAFRVLHVIASVDKAMGGPAQVLYQTLESLPLGYEMEVVSLDDPTSKPVREFPGVVHGVGPTARRYGYTPRLAGWIIQNASRFHAAVIHGLWNHASIGGWQGCYRSRLPYVVFTHGMLDPWFRRSSPGKHWLKQAFWLVQGRVLRDASEVLFTCSEEQRLASGAFFGYSYRSAVVAFGTSDAPHSGPADIAQFQAVIPALGGKPYILFLGRLHTKKGCDLLIEGFSRSVRREELQLVIAGPDQDGLSAKLRSLAAELGVGDRVHWPGMLMGAQKAGAFLGAEVFALTSHQENFGIAIAEALSYGVPVLISDQVNIWREVTEGGGGLAAPDTVEGAAELISKWESLGAIGRSSMRALARSTYEKRFTMSVASEELCTALSRAYARGMP